MLARGSQLAGSDQKLLPHSIRRGAASDLVTVSQQLTGDATATVGAELNHSSSSVSWGVTRKYTRMRTNQDTWALRSNITLSDAPFTDINFTAPMMGRPPSPTQPSMKEKSRGVCDECKAVGDDPENPQSYEAARNRLRRRVDPYSAAPGDVDTSVSLQVSMHQSQESTFQPARSSLVRKCSKATKESTKWTDSEIIAECTRKGRDPDDRSERKKARERLSYHSTKSDKEREVKEYEAASSSVQPARAKIRTIEGPEDMLVELPPAHLDHGNPKHTATLNNPQSLSFMVDIDCLRVGERSKQCRGQGTSEPASQVEQHYGATERETRTQLEIKIPRNAFRGVAAECGELRKVLAESAPHIVCTHVGLATSEVTPLTESRKRRKTQIRMLDSIDEDISKHSRPEVEEPKRAFHTGVAGTPISRSNAFTIGYGLGYVPTKFDSSTEQSLHTDAKGNRTTQPPASIKTDIVSLLMSEEDKDLQGELTQLMQSGLMQSEESITGDELPPNDPKGISAISSAAFISHFASINIVWLARRVPEDKPAPLTWVSATAAGLDSNTSIAGPVQLKHW